MAPDPTREGLISSAPRIRAWVSFGLILLAGCGVIWQSQKLLHADLASVAARSQILDWAADAAVPASPQTWGVARANVLESLSITPDDPDLLERLGDVDVVAGKRDWDSPPRRTQDFGRAAANYQAAIALRPSEPQTWAMLAISRQAMGASHASVHDAWARAHELGPFEGHVQPILMQVVLADWAGASPDMQQWATHLFDEGDEGTRRDINALAARYGVQFNADSSSR